VNPSLYANAGTIRSPTSPRDPRPSRAELITVNPALPVKNLQD